MAAICHILWLPYNETTITYSLEPIEGGTRVTVRHEGFADRLESCRGHGEGWERVLAWLGRHFAPKEAPKFFLVRLLPPRPSFMADMTAEEMDVMRRHAGYWAELLEQGVAIAYGPVADPKGGWGTGILDSRGTGHPARWFLARVKRRIWRVEVDAFANCPIDTGACMRNMIQ